MSTNDLERGLKALSESEDAYKTAGQYYDGTIPEYFANESIRKKLTEGGSPYKLNFAAIPVNRRIDRMKITSYDTGSTNVDEVLRNGFIKPNNLDQDLTDYFRKAAYLGDYYLILWEGEGDGTTNAEGESRVTTVDVFGNSPLVCRIIYSRENSRRAAFAIKAWEADDSTAKDPHYRVNLYYPDVIEQYESSSSLTDASTFTALVSNSIDENGESFAEDDFIENPYGFPVFHLRQGDKPYGVPVNKAGWGSQDIINKLNVTHVSTIDYLGIPQRYALQEGGDEEDLGDDWVDFETSAPASSPEIATSRMVKKKSKLKAGPAEMWWLKGIREVGTFEVANPETFTDPMTLHVRMMAVLTGTPLYEFDTSGEQPSGESRRRADAPMKASIDSMASGYGQTIENAASFALSILGYPNTPVTVKWAPTDFATAQSDWETIGLKLKHGVPLRTALSEAGYDDAEIGEWYPDDAPALSVGQLTDLAEVLSKLGTAVTLGSITTEEVRDALPMILSGDAPEVVREVLAERTDTTDEVVTAGVGGDVTVDD